MSKQQDIADTMQSWCWIALGWGCFLLSALMSTLDGILVGLACGTAANIIGTYVGLRRLWRKK